MKNYLLSLTTAALLATGAQAQMIHNINAKKTQRDFPAMMLNQSTASKQGQQLKKLQPKLIQSLNRNVNARVDDTKRSHKELSYQVNGDESSNASLVRIGLDFAEMAKNGVTGIGYAHLYTPEQLRGLAGNKLSQIVFSAWMGNYNGAIAFVVDPNEGRVLWTGNISEIKTINANFEGEYNVVDCNYQITGNEQALLVGWLATSATPAQNDPYYANNGIVTIAYDDHTNLGNGTFIMASQEGSLVIYDNLKPLQDENGRIQMIASDIFCLTEGDAAIPDTDASFVTANPIRTLVGSEKGLDMFIQNCGLDPITSVECEFTLDGKTSLAKYDLPQPILYLQTGGISPKALLPETACAANGTVEIIKINGADDAYVTDNDNIGDYTLVTMDKAYNRTPVYEIHNCTETDFADDGVMAVNKFNKNYGDKEGIALHGFAQLYQDYPEPLESKSYFDVINNFFQGKLPCAFANREYVSTQAYKDVDALTQAVLESPAEASISVEADSPSGFGSNATLDAKAKITFSTNAPKDKYGVSFILTEDQVEQPIFSYLGYFVNGYMDQGADENWLKQNLGFDDEQIAYGKNAQSDKNGDYYATTALDGVILGTSDPMGNKTLLPEIKSGQEYEIDFQSIPYNGARKPSIVEENLNVVALLIDQETYAIVTAVKTPINSTSLPSSINTVNKEGGAQIEALNGAFSVKATNATAEVYTLDGRLVSSCTVNGEASLPTFGQGTYIIRVVEGNKIISKKAVF